MGVTLQPERDRPAPPGVLDRVGDQVVDQLPETLTVDRGDQPRWGFAPQGQPGRVDLGAPGLDRLVDQCDEVDFCALQLRAAITCLGHLEQIGHQVLEPMRVALDHLAFANLARATRLGGRLVMLVWRGIEDNEWLREFFGAIGRVLPMAPPPADAPGPFSLSDPDRVRDLLHGAGWTDVNLTAKDELLCFGPDANTATTFIVGQMKWLFEKLDDVGKRQVEANLHDVMAAHAAEDGVFLGSGARIITARR